MAEARRQQKTWKFRNIRFGGERESALVAYWEVDCDPISDEYTPDEITARELFGKWLQRYGKRYENGLVPIHWFVEGKRVLEFMPFQFKHSGSGSDENFLTFYTWPVDSNTGDSLNWLTLPVVDKFWNSKRADKGGFIQEATRWKPAILQPYVYLPSLMNVFQAP